jgi:ribonuclease HI
VCSKGCGIGCVIVSPHSVKVSLSNRLEFGCTNNEAGYEALCVGLEYVVDMGIRNIDSFGDLMVVV